MQRKTKLWIGLAIIVVLGIAGWGAYTLIEGNQANTQTSQSGYQTQKASVGNLTTTASGTGSLIAGKQVDLNFLVSGTVAQLNVQVGDTVSAGDVLAILDGQDDLEENLESLQADLDDAQQDLDDLQNNGAELIAEALSDLSDAQSSYQDALDNLHQKGDPRCEESLTKSYYNQYVEIKKSYDYWASEYKDYFNSGSIYGIQYIEEHVDTYKASMDEAYLNYRYCEGYTDQEIAKSEANLQLAKAQVDLAQKTYDERVANNGATAAELALAEAKVADLEAQVKVAKEEIASTTIVAPMDGTVTYIAADEGGSVDTSTFITLADLNYPEVQFYVDVTDLENVAVGCSAQVTFTAAEDRVYQGTISELSPTLSGSGFFSNLQGVIDLSDDSILANKVLLLGANATVNITCSQAQNVLLVSTEALHEAADESYYVYVLNQGEPEKRTVEVGLKTTSLAVILNGLSQGEQVVVSLDRPEVTPGARVVVTGEAEQ